VLGKDGSTARRAKAFVVAMFVAILMTLSSAALAQQEGYSNNEPDTEVRFGTTNQPSVDEDAAAGEGLLPFTGADLTLFVATGLAAIGTGVVVLRRTRPREE
jgi:hypothetical protein